MVFSCSCPDKKDKKKGNRALVACPSHLVATSSILLLCQSFASIRTNFLGVPTETEVQKPSRNPPGSSARRGLLRCPASWTEQLQDARPFTHETAIGILGRHPVRHSNESYVYVYAYIVSFFI